MVLVGSDGHKAGLQEGKGAEVPVCVQVTVGRRIHVHHMEAWLVAMHGVQYHLARRGSEKTKKSEVLYLCSPMVEDKDTLVSYK